jgi:hypothetical protein
VRQGVGDQGQAARHEEHADARADDGRHGARDERALHEGVLEKLRPHHECSCDTIWTEGPYRVARAAWVMKFHENGETH